MTGKINSIETMGLVDGPGVRIVIFMQGCPLRCIFCHNPETWDINKKCEEYTSKQIVDKVLNYLPYFGDKGGVTFSGGEPLMQKEFLTETLKLLKEKGINTCIDTAGSIPNCYDILKYTDLVILDIKALDKENYKYITNGNIKLQDDFIKLCQSLNKKLWIRQVIIPGINDNINYIKKLANYIKEIKNVEKIELLPYHTLGVNKYKKLNLNYKLENVPDMDASICKSLENELIKLLNIKS